MRARYGERLRRFLKTFQTRKLVDFGELKVFQDAATFPLILIVEKNRGPRKPLYAPIKRLDFENLSQEVESVGFELGEGALSDEGFALVGPAAAKLPDKIRAVGKPLGEYIEDKVYYGIKTGFNEAFIINRDKRDELIKKDPGSADIIKPFVIGDDVRRYRVNFSERFLIFARHGIDIEKYPVIKGHLARWKNELMPRTSKKDRVGRKPGSYKWYEIQDTIDYYAEFEKPKIVWPVIAKESRFALDETGLFHNDKAFFVPIDDKYLLGILNSKLVWFFLRQICSCLGDVDKKGRLELRKIYVEKVPIPEGTAPLKTAIATWVEQMIALYRRLAKTRAEADRIMIERQIKGIDRQIDEQVYKLYGLSKEEIRIIEEPAA